MRITIGSGNRSQTVVVPTGKAYRDQPHYEKERFKRQFCQLAGISR